MRPLRVVVVEDDSMIGPLLAEVLEDLGHVVVAVVVDAAVAVVAARDCRPDLMIVDARLGDGSGLSAVEQIDRTGSIPHLFVSGDASRVRVLRPGAVVLQKPYRESDLVRAIQRVVDAAGKQ